MEIADRHEFRFNGLLIIAPNVWYDITDDINEEETPLTLAKEDGVGALQFSTGMLACGLDPKMQVSDLVSILDRFAASRNYISLGVIEKLEANLRACYGDYLDREFFVRTWICSNGTNIVLATYYCGSQETRGELADCTMIIQNLSFTE